MFFKKPQLLVFIKTFWQYPKHQPKIDMIKALERYADIYYWYDDGHIDDILNVLKVKPDFIFHYDIAWNYGLAPKIDGLAEVDIPIGCFVIDLHWDQEQRIKYFEDNKIDVIFSVSKNPFLQEFPKYKYKLCWIPWSINPQVMKDWGQPKDIDYLLMGAVYVDPHHKHDFELPKHIPPKGRYAFRDAVFEQLTSDPGFNFHPHPGHRAKDSKELIVNENYAKELNRAKIFFTCGSRHETGGIAVLKFFEALACKTLLLAESNDDIIELGFKDGENFVACTVDDLAEKAKFYLNNNRERQRITENGYRFVHAEHTHDERAKKMIAVIKTFI